MAKSMFLFLCVMVLSVSIVSGAGDWNASYVIRKDGFVVGSESFGMTMSDGFNLLSGKTVIAGEYEGTYKVNRKFKYRSWPPFFEPFSAVVSASSETGADKTMVRLKVRDGQMHVNDGPSVKLGKMQAVFLDPCCPCTYSGLILAYDFPAKGKQTFSVIIPLLRQVKTVSVDYRGEDTSSFAGESVVRIFRIKGLGTREITVKANPWGRVLYVENPEAGFEAWLEGAGESAIQGNEAKTNGKNMKVAIGAGSDVIEGEFSLPSIDIPSPFCVLFVKSPFGDSLDEKVVKCFGDSGCPVLVLAPQMGFKKDYAFVRAAVRWLGKRDETAKLPLYLVGSGIAAFPVWEYVLKHSKDVETLLLINPETKTLAEQLMASLDDELASEGYTEEYGASARDKFRTFLHNVNSQSTGYRGVLKHSIDDIAGWFFPRLDGIADDPAAFDGYIRLSFPRKCKAVSVPLRVIAASRDKKPSVVEGRLRRIFGELSSSSVGIKAFSPAAKDDEVKKEIHIWFPELASLE